MLKELDKVVLFDGTACTVLEVFDSGKAYLVEFKTANGPHKYDDKIVALSDIAGMQSHVSLDSFGS